MRNFWGVCLLLCLLIATLPFLSFVGKNSEPKLDKNDDKKTTIDSGKLDKVKVYLTESGEVLELSAGDYLFGAVAAEMPVSYHTEALKAQVVTCYTYALYHMMQQQETPSEELKGAYLTDDTNRHQGYLSYETLEEKWGDNYEKYASKLTEAIEAVLGEVMVHDGQPIMAVYHAISAGKTESAEVYWGSGKAYLQSVLSSGDKLSPDFSKTVELSPDEFKKAIDTMDDSLEYPEDAGEWLGELTRSDSDTVTLVNVCGKDFTGRDFRDAFELRSACFSIAYQEDKFVITTSGFGHGVGMSQYGADYMARQGSDYKEILNHYFTGVAIKQATAL